MPNSKSMFQVTTFQSVIWDLAFRVTHYIRLPGHNSNVLEKLAVSQTVPKFPACCGAQSFFTVPICFCLSRATL